MNGFSKGSSQQNKKERGLRPETSAGTETRVYVDAKIIGRHDPNLPKITLVAYIAQGPEPVRGVSTVEGADETDHAELQAVAFAIKGLKGKPGKYTIVCDHQSVVFEIQRGTTRPRSKPILSEIQQALRENSIKVEWLEKNPAHKLLNQFQAEMEKRDGLSVRNE